MKDLAGMKMRVIQVRGCGQGHRPHFRSEDKRESPSVYGDGTLNRVPASIQRDLTHWAQAVDLANRLTCPIFLPGTV